MAEDDNGISKRKKLRVVVGQPWTEEDAKIEIHDRRFDAVRAGVLVGFALFFGALFAIFVLYGMLRSDSVVVERAFVVVVIGLLALVTWAVGPKAIKTVMDFAKHLSLK